MRLEPLTRSASSILMDGRSTLRERKARRRTTSTSPKENAEGRITGRFRGSNHPHRRTDETFAMNIQGFIETDDSALIMLDYQGYGRSSDRSQELYKLIPNTNPATKFPRQVVGFAKHTTDSEKHRWLNDAVCAVAGEVRVPMEIPPEKLKQADVKLVFSVAEVIWESPPE